MVRTIIVDDESSALQNMEWELQQFCPQAELIGKYTDPKEAISAIDSLRPDCVFLDIQMPEMDGFALLERLSYRNFALVITTAFENYALKAFKENAIDYLMKPVDSDDLVKCIAKVERMTDRPIEEFDIKRLTDLMMASRPETERSRIPLHLNGKIIYQDIDDITFCEADGNYTTIHTKDGNKTVVSKKIKEIDAMLPDSKFYRVHQSFVVNMACIKEFVRSDGQYLLIEDGVTVPVSRAKRAEVLELLEHI